MRPAGRRRHIPPAILAVMLDYRHSQRREVALPGFPAPPGSLLAMRGWGGGCRRGIRVPCQRLGWDRREARWLERGRQGRGNEFPLPVGPSPRGDITTVQCTGRSRRRAGHGGPPAPPRIRFPTSSTPDTISHRLHPGYGCSPDIATHGPCPREGAGEERRRRGRGGGCRQKRMGSLPPQARAGWGMPAEVYGYPLPQARAGWGMPAEVYGYPLPKARVGRGLPAEAYGYSRGKAGGVRVPANCIGIPLRRRERGGGCRQRRMGTPAEKPAE